MTSLRRISCLMFAAAAVLTAAGCGGSSDKTKAAAPTIRNAPAAGTKRWTEAQVMKAAGLRTDDGGITYTTASGCSAAVVMTNAATVDVYSSAGDTVVTNPDGTAGVKTSGDEPHCLAEFQRGLATLK